VAYREFDDLPSLLKLIEGLSSLFFAAKLAARFPPPPRARADRRKGFDLLWSSLCIAVVTSLFYSFNEEAISPFPYGLPNH